MDHQTACDKYDEGSSPFDKAVTSIQLTAHSSQVSSAHRFEIQVRQHDMDLGLVS